MQAHRRERAGGGGKAEAEMGGDDVATRGTPGAVGRWARETGSSPENPKAARPRGALDAEPLTRSP